MQQSDKVISIGIIIIILLMILISDKEKLKNSQKITRKTIAHSFVIGDRIGD